MTDTTPSRELLQITWQLAAAFGQGAGTIQMAPDALQPAFDAYREDLEAAVGDWQSRSLITVEYMRALGAAAAFRARLDERLTLTTEHVEKALGILRRESLLQPCSITNLARDLRRQ